MKGQPNDYINRANAPIVVPRLKELLSVLWFVNQVGAFRVACFACTLSITVCAFV